MRSVWMLCVGIASFGACATASESEEPGTSDAATSGETSTTRDTGSTTDSSSTSDTGSSETSTSTDASTTDAKTDGGGTDAKADTAVAGACDAPSDCMGARDLGSLDGDDGNGVVSTAGTSSEWIKVRLAEKKRGPLYVLDRTPVKFKATLTSTGNTNYDLFVYYDKAADNVECVTETMSSETTGVEEVADNWGDSSGDDSRTVNIEVRRKSGNCGSSGGWTLDVAANVN